jgi:hypothetical protein
MDGKRNQLAGLAALAVGIAYFDLFAASVFLWAAKQSDARLKIRATAALCGLSFLLGLNHLSGWLEKTQVFHALFTIANLAAVAWGVAAIGRGTGANR